VDETWLLSTTATSDATVPLTYAGSGLHGYFQVVAHLDAFVTHNGFTTTTSLVHNPKTDCCTPPSGGFSYTGSHSFAVATGDTYGFTLGGSNYDSNHAFYGTLTVNPSAPSAPPVPYTDQAAAGACCAPVDLRCQRHRAARRQRRHVACPCDG
jgi:hypothetical protein